QSGLLEDGTAIGSGLATGVDRLRNSPSKSKVIILLTDGENNGGLIDPNTAKENESLSNIYKEIDQLEKSKIEVSSIRRYTEQFFPFALAAAIFLFLEMLLRWTVLRKFP